VIFVKKMKNYLFLLLPAVIVSFVFMNKTAFAEESACQDWEMVKNLGGNIKYNPSVIAAGDKLMVTGVGQEDAVWANEFLPATGQGEWYNIAGTTYSQTKMIIEDNKPVVYAIGVEGNAWKRIYQSPRLWTEWFNTGATSIGAGGPATAVVNSVIYRAVRNGDGSTQIDKCASRICAPGSVSGCKVCDTAGIFWVDTDFKCATGQVCEGGVCVTAQTREWVFGTESVERKISFSGGKFFLKSFKNLKNGRELVPTGNFSEEFSFSLGNTTNIVGSLSGGWKLVNSSELSLGQGEKQLAITLQKDNLQVTKYYMAYPGTSVIREWVSFKNIGNAPATIINPSFFSLGARAGNFSSTDFMWMTGGMNYPGSWKLMKEAVGTNIRKFDSYDPFPGTTEGYGFKPGSYSYAPWYALYGSETKSGLFIGWDYFGHWQSSFNSGADGAVFVKINIAGFEKKLAAGESFDTPKAFAGLYTDDLDNAGNESLYWQYKYLWDYTRDKWFPKTRMAGNWSIGTDWSAGWMGGVVDQKSIFLSILRITDLIRAAGGDVYHRDWGWWDKAGDWNGPDFKATGDYLKKHGMGQLIYAFVYNAVADSAVGRQHPDWLVGGGNVLDMSNAGVVQFIENKLDEFVAKWGDFEWRNDSWFTAGNDTIMLAQDQNFRKILKNFLDKHPGSAFQAVNGGGMYAGYDYVRYASSISFSDGAVGALGNYWASLMLPPDKSSDIGDVWRLDNYDKSTWRGLLCFQSEHGWETNDPAKLEGIRQLFDIYHYLQNQEVAGRWSKIYRPQVIGDDATMYMQRMSGDDQRGIIIPKHRAAGTVTIKPKGLISGANYFVSFQESPAAQTRSGADLMANGVTIANMPAGELVYLNLPMHPGSNLDTTPPVAPTNVAQKKGENMGFPGVEISWNAAADNNWVSYYEIFRNGKFLDKIAKGTFYFDHSAGADIAAVYEVRAFDGAGLVSAKVAASGAVGSSAKIYDDRDFTYSGAWQKIDNLANVAHNGTLSKNNQKGAFAELNFEGKNLTLFLHLGSSNGVAAVSVDDGIAEIIDTYAADDIWGAGIFQKQLSSGRHKIRIEAISYRNAHPAEKIKDTYVAIDGLRVEPEEADCQNWSAVKNLGGNVKYNPSMVGFGNKLVVSGVGQEDAVWANEFILPTGQGEWYFLAGTTYRQTKMAVEGGNLAVYAIGVENSAWKRQYQSTKIWTNWLNTGLTNMGFPGPMTATVDSMLYRAKRNNDGTVQIDKCAPAQNCAPNAVSGCKVCNPAGTAWADNNSKCAANQTCQNGICVADCAAKTCAALGNYHCGSWSDGCGAILQCGACTNGKTCSNGQCVANCASRVSKKCDGGKLYWYNSCNTKEELFQDCGNNVTINDYRCSGNWIQKESIARGCSSNACNSVSSWSNLNDCAASGKKCKSGVCVAAKGYVEPTDPPAIDATIKMTRAEILAKISQIQKLIAELQKQLLAVTGKTAYSCVQITKNLFYGMKNDPQVKCLQEILKAQGYAVVATGDYGGITKAAVKQFQQKYAQEILAPFGLHYGSGNVGNATKTKINALMIK